MCWAGRGRASQDALATLGWLANRSFSQLATKSLFSARFGIWGGRGSCSPPSPSQSPLQLIDREGIMGGAKPPPSSLSFPRIPLRREGEKQKGSLPSAVSVASLSGFASVFKASVCVAQARGKDWAVHSLLIWIVFVFLSSETAGNSSCLAGAGPELAKYHFEWQRGGVSFSNQGPRGSPHPQDFQGVASQRQRALFEWLLRHVSFLTAVYLRGSPLILFIRLCLPQRLWGGFSPALRPSSLLGPARHRLPHWRELGAQGSVLLIIKAIRKTTLGSFPQRTPKLPNRLSWFNRSSFS